MAHAAPYAVHIGTPSVLHRRSAPSNTAQSMSVLAPKANFCARTGNRRGYSTSAPTRALLNSTAPREGPKRAAHSADSTHPMHAPPRTPHAVPTTSPRVFVLHTIATTVPNTGELRTFEPASLENTVLCARLRSDARPLESAARSGQSASSRGGRGIAP